MELPLTKSENDGINDQNSHHETAESVVQNKPLDASPPGTAGTATRCHDGRDLVSGATCRVEREERLTRGFFSAQKSTKTAKAIMSRLAG